MKALLILILTICALLVAAANSRDSIGAETMVVDAFKVLEHTPEGDLAWALLGERAIVARQRVELTHAQATLRDGEGKHIVRAPASTYLPDEQLLRGTDGVTLYGNGFYIRGDAFDLDLGAQELIVRRNVVVEFDKAPLKSLGKQPKND